MCCPESRPCPAAIARQHLANGGPLRGALPMTGLRVMPRLECENDVRGRFTICPSGNSHGSPCLSADPTAFKCPCRKAVQRRWEGGISADRSGLRVSARRPGTRPRPTPLSPGRALPGHRPSPSCEGSLERERPQGRVGMCTCRPSPMPIEACRDGGSLPSPAACSGAASALRRPWCNCNAASHMRKRWRAHEVGVFVHMYPVV